MNRHLIGGLAVAVAALGVAIGAQRGGNRVRLAPGQECPPGTTETRPGVCQAPEFPPPSIVDYRPRSTLVTAEHPVPQVEVSVDRHPRPSAVADQRRIDRPRGRGDGQAEPARDGERRQLVRRSADARARRRSTRARTRIDSACWPASISATSDPAGARRAVAQLEADIKAGAVGVGEVPKSFGLRNRKPDGSRLQHRRSRTRSDLGGVRPSRRAGRSSTPPSRRNSSSRSTCTTSAGSSCRCLPIAATTSLAG